jgi:hypothetical protein
MADFLKTAAVREKITLLAGIEVKACRLPHLMKLHLNGPHVDFFHRFFKSKSRASD